MIDKDDKIIDIEKEAISIGALPKDVRTVYNNSEDNRVFENAFNNINNTIDENEMFQFLMLFFYNHEKDFFYDFVLLFSYFFC